MPINLEGVELLKADLRANKDHYKQQTFGRVTACGTEQCMAGFCYLRKVGQKAYTAAIEDEADMQELCVEPGLTQLGIECEPGDCPTIFDTYNIWPHDLADAYRDAKTADERVTVACAALDRLNDDGTIKALDQI